MPPSQEETFLKGKDTTNTNFDHDISYSDPSAASKTSEPHDRSCLIASEPPIDKTKKNNKASFLKLPVEIRLLIYDLLLIAGVLDLGYNYRWTIGPGGIWWEGLLRPYMGVGPYAEVGILRTCRQIYHEASPILYSKNNFEFGDPEKALRFIEQIGPVNLKLIKKLDLFKSHLKEFLVNLGTMLDTTAESPILRVLDILADEGLGICDVNFTWFFKHRKTYSWRSDAKLYIRTLEKIKEKIPTGLERELCASIQIKFCGNTRPSSVVEASARSGYNCWPNQMGEMGALAQTGPLRSGIVGHAPTDSDTLHTHTSRITSILE